MFDSAVFLLDRAATQIRRGRTEPLLFHNDDEAIVSDVRDYPDTRVLFAAGPHRVVGGFALLGVAAAVRKALMRMQ